MVRRIWLVRSAVTPIRGAIEWASMADRKGIVSPAKTIVSIVVLHLMSLPGGGRTGPV